MELPLLSVIIPVYNVEDYVGRCVESVINQLYQNLEIILINDGSTDQSGKICMDYARIESRVRFINKTNEGLSSARNAGIDIAKGDYITFVDSDDYIDPDSYNLNMDILIEQRNISIVQFPVERQGIIGGIPAKPYLICGEKEIFANWWSNDIITSSVCNKIFRKEVFATTRFPIGQIYEDHFLIVDFSETVQNVYLSDKGCYHYVVRDNSITTSKVTMANCISFYKVHLKVYKKFFSYEDLRPYRLTAFSRVFRKLITARRIDHKTDLKTYINELKDLEPDWKDIAFTESAIRERLWVLCVKIFGMGNFLHFFSWYLNIRKADISL